MKGPRQVTGSLRQAALRRRALNSIQRRARLRREPWAGEPTPIVHVAHHKVGTLWFRNALATVAAHFGLSFSENQPDEVAVYWHSRDFDPARYDRFTGSHMIRDPRDVVVSGYHYHLHTDEEWARERCDELGGRSYQEHLKRLSPEEGLLAEIRQAPWNTLRDMAAWEPRPEILELRYEDVIGHERATFEAVFRHHGFRPGAARVAAELCDRFTFRRVTGREIGQVDPTAHLRSGKPGQWQEMFASEHQALFEELYPGLVERLGYHW